MRAVETLTWMLVAGVVISYVGAKQAKAVAKTMAPPPSAQREVDPTRWRHRGDQPIDWGDWRGNGDREDDPEVLALRNALAF